MNNQMGPNMVNYNNKVMRDYYGGGNKNNGDAKGIVLSIIMFVLSVAHAFLLYPMVKDVIASSSIDHASQLYSFITNGYLIVTIIFIVASGWSLFKRNNVLKIIYTIILIGLLSYYVYLCYENKALIDPFVREIEPVEDFENNEDLESNTIEGFKEWVKVEYKLFLELWEADNVIYTEEARTYSSDDNLLKDQDIKYYTITISEEGKVIDYHVENDYFSFDYSGEELLIDYLNNSENYVVLD